MMLGICAFVAVSLSAQKNKKIRDILHTEDIGKIERFLATAHPEDPRRTVLKPKLINLKNKSWTKPGQATPMPVYKVDKNSENSVVVTNPETEEFQQLISISQNEHKSRTVNLLNTLFDNDKNSTETILLVRNNSDCNMILRINGADKKHNLAVPAKGENTLVIKKGRYDMTANVCSGKYASVKDIQKSSQIILNSTPIKLLAKASAAPAIGKKLNAQK